MVVGEVDPAAEGVHVAVRVGEPEVLEGVVEELPGAAVEGFLHVEEEHHRPLVVVGVDLNVGLEELHEHRVLCDEGVGGEAVLGVGDYLHDGLVHSLGEHAHHDFVVTVEQGDGAVIAGVVACLLFVEDGDESFAHLVW